MPDFPGGMESLWEWFLKLSRRRQSGMAPNPISFQEIEAFERKSLVRLTAWEADVIIRLDDAVLAVLARSHGPASGLRGDEPPAPIQVDDVPGMKSLFRGIATAKRVQREAQQRRA